MVSSNRVAAGRSPSSELNSDRRRMQAIEHMGAGLSLPTLGFLRTYPASTVNFNSRQWVSAYVT
jgi:hypothetical protein